jgi:hypothetical protein
MKRAIYTTVAAIPLLSLLGYILWARLQDEFDDLVGASDFETWDPELDWLFEGEWEEAITKEER